VSEGAAYRLDLGPGELDLDEVRGWVDAARAVGPEHLDRVIGLLRQARAAWRGRALDEFTDIEPLAVEAVAIEELRRDVDDELLEARLAAGGDADLVADAVAAASSEPLRERTQQSALRALAATGRQAEALRLAHDFRTRLADETGLDPSPAFTELEQEIATGVLTDMSPGERRRPVPAPVGPLIGREVEVERLRRLVDDERLVTVVGPGGVGKTRLAAEVAAHVDAAGAREVFVIELAAASDERTVVEALVSGVRVRTSSNDAALDLVAERLVVGGAVVVLDNCEHLLEIAARVVEHLVLAPGVTVLATSREPLSVRGEQVVRLGPLPVPDAATTTRAALERVPAFAAFLAYARRHDATLVGSDDEAVAVAEIVRRLDGLPLALELAAGRAATLGVAGEHDRLGRALDVLGSASGPTRHSTLRTAIEWSAQLLTPDEARLLRFLAVFPAGVDLEGAEHVAALAGLRGDPTVALARLVEASMVVAEAGTPQRFRLLETVRAFALDELGRRGEVEAAGDLLLAWAGARATEIALQGHTADEARADARLRAELANLRAAHELAVAHGDVEWRVALVLDLWELVLRRDLAEIWGWTIALAGDDALRGHPRRVAVLGIAARSLWMRGELDRAWATAQEGLDVVADGGDRERCLSAAAAVALFRGDPDEAERLWVEAEAVADPAPMEYPSSAALAAGYAGRLDDAHEALRRAFVGAETDDVPVLPYCHYVRAELCAEVDPTGAAEDYGIAIELSRARGGTFVEGVAAVGLVSLWARTGRREWALAGFRWLVDHWRRSGSWTLQWTTLRNAAELLADVGEDRAALLLLVAADDAPEASVVDPERRERLDALVRTLEARLGDAATAAVHRHARTAGRLGITEEATAALTRAGATGDLVAPIHR
jgi:predicted ATPase